MDKRTTAIQQDIDDTQHSMTEKMEQIEGRVRGTANHVRSSMDDTVDRTVDNVREGVNSNIDRMKEQIDVQQLVDEHPWLMVGGSILAGYTLGGMTGSRDRSEYDEYPYATAAAAHESHTHPSDSTDATDEERRYRYYDDDDANRDTQHARPSRPSRRAQAKAASSDIVDDVLDQFGEEVDTLKEAAVSTMTRLLRETLRDNVPQLAEEFERARAERRSYHARRENGGAHLDTPQDQNRETSVVEPAAAQSDAVPFSHAQKEQDEENSTSSIVESVRHKM